jgi:glycosyltransferase involved in cell wall biosynthesis
MAGKDLGLLQETKRLAEELKIHDAIVYPGYVFTEDKTKLAQKTDVYLCTNKIDNAPVTFIEMMAMGLPIVSVNVGGIPFIVSHEENGLLVNYDDDAAMFNCIDAVIQNPALGIKIAQNGLTFLNSTMKKWCCLNGKYFFINFQINSSLCVELQASFITINRKRLMRVY